MSLFSFTNSLSLFNNTVCSGPFSVISQLSKHTNYFNNTLRVLKLDNWAQDAGINVLIAVRALNWASQFTQAFRVLLCICSQAFQCLKT